jgi:hypothetical protein
MFDPHGQPKDELWLPWESAMQLEWHALPPIQGAINPGHEHWLKIKSASVLFWSRSPSAFFNSDKGPAGNGLMWCIIDPKFIV